METCGCYFPFAASETHYVLAEDGHCQNTITSKRDLTAKAGSPDTMGYLHPEDSPMYQHTAICCVNGEGFALQCETSLLSTPN